MVQTILVCLCFIETKYNKVDNFQLLVYSHSSSFCEIRITGRTMRDTNPDEVLLELASRICAAVTRQNLLPKSTGAVTIRRISQDDLPADLLNEFRAAWGDPSQVEALPEDDLELYRTIVVPLHTQQTRQALK